MDTTNKARGEQIGWYGETLNAVLDRRPAPAQKPAFVGYDPQELAKILGR